MNFHISRRGLNCVTVLAVILATGFESNGAAQTLTPAPSSNVSLGDLGALNGWVPSPNDAWHQDISNAAIDPASATIINTSGDLADRKRR